MPALRRSHALSYRSVASVLRHGLDAIPINDLSDVVDAPLEHENLHGADYYVN
ncbi:MAG: hypothetical protein JWN04_5219 [Myxococcaceae bacterium]|nr:hypothetical protein [Myxococcaceae bacterium]